jgi:hypothetical protein
MLAVGHRSEPARRRGGPALRGILRLRHAARLAGGSIFWKDRARRFYWSLLPHPV